MKLILKIYFFILLIILLFSIYLEIFCVQENFYQKSLKNKNNSSNSNEYDYYYDHHYDVDENYNQLEEADYNQLEHNIDSD